MILVSGHMLYGDLRRGSSWRAVKWEWGARRRLYSAI